MTRASDLSLAASRDWDDSGLPATSRSYGFRERLLYFLEPISKIAARESAERVSQRALDLRRQIEENRFHLVVVGQFKRGKTSFLNALLGDQILPVALVPLTSIVTVLKYGRQPKAEAVLQSGQHISIDISELSDYVTENGNPANAKAVDHVEVFYPSDHLRHGAVLIDTPGIGSTYAHNTSTTYEFLPRVDAAIFITSPEPPITATEIEFLTELRRQVDRIFVVMNKADIVEPKDLEVVLEFARRNLPEGIAGDQIFAISARRALEAWRAGNRREVEESGFEELETELRQFLAKDRDNVFLSSAQRRLNNLIADLRMYLHLQHEAATMPVDRAQATLSALEDHLRLANTQKQDYDKLLQASLEQFSSVVDSEIRRFVEMKTGPLQMAIKVYFDCCKAMPRKQLTAAMDHFLSEQIHSSFDSWRLQFEGSLTASLRQATARFQTAVNELVQRVRDRAANLFRFPIQPLEGVDDLAPLETTGYRTDTLLNWGLGSAPSLLPGRLYRQYVLRRMLRMASMELDRNAGRVAYDLKRRIETSSAQFRKRMDGRLDDAIGGIQCAIQQGLNLREAGAAAAERRLAALHSELMELDLLAEAITAFAQGF